MLVRQVARERADRGGGAPADDRPFRIAADGVSGAGTDHAAGHCAIRRSDGVLVALLSEVADFHVDEEPRLLDVARDLVAALFQRLAEVLLEVGQVAARGVLVVEVDDAALAVDGVDVGKFVLPRHLHLQLLGAGVDEVVEAGAAGREKRGAGQRGGNGNGTDVHGCPFVFFGGCLGKGNAGNGYFRPGGTSSTVTRSTDERTSGSICPSRTRTETGPGFGRV